MCVYRGAPRKPAYGPCHESHSRREQVKIPIMSDLSAMISEASKFPDTIVEFQYKTEWRYC